MKPTRIFKKLQEIKSCESRIQLPTKSASWLLTNGFIKEVKHEEQWSLGKFTCIFHELTNLGVSFLENYKKKGQNVDVFKEFMEKV